VGELGIAGLVHVVVEDGAAALHGFEGERLIGGAEAQAAKALRIKAIGLGTDQIALGSTSPKVGTASVKEEPRLLTKRKDELVGIAALKSRAREIQQQLLEGLLRVRRVVGRRVAEDAGQCASPIDKLNN